MNPIENFTSVREYGEKSEYVHCTRDADLLESGRSVVDRELAEKHNVSTRSGDHCAPLAHETSGTLPGQRTIRFSFGFSNTVEEVERLLESLSEVPRLKGQIDWVV
jgi:Aminotransferase class-V